MTDIELQEYNKLSVEGRNYYNMGMSQHPEWSHKQALTFATICIITAGDPPQEPPTPTTLKEILISVVSKAQIFISDRFPRIYAQVKTTFDNVISKVKSGLIKAWNEIISWFA